MKRYVAASSNDTFPLLLRRSFTQECRRFALSGLLSFMNAMGPRPGSQYVCRCQTVGTGRYARKSQ